MGKVNHQPSIHHFSHPHPLELQVPNQQQEATKVPVSCSGCEQEVSDMYYACKACNFVLHISCSQLSQLINHQVDPVHSLSLLPVPAYPEGFFDCDACGQSGYGFSYHCEVCNIDIHTRCAVMPLSINTQFHLHPLTLTFYPPYHNKSFGCDICFKIGSNHWLYRCVTCHFDAHLGCVRTRPERLLQAQPQLTEMIYQQTLQTSVAHQNQAMLNQYMPSNMNNPNQVLANQRGAQGSTPLFKGVLQSFATAAAQDFGRDLMKDVMGGGRGGGSRF